MNTHVCDSSHAWALDNSFRKKVHNPGIIFKGLTMPGHTVIDLGCGPGTFSIDLAGLVAESGKVIAVDLQDKMLRKLKEKAERYGFTERITLHKCSGESLGLAGQCKADFILAFYMVHEVSDRKNFFLEIKELLKPDGTFLFVEPKFHVSQKAFEEAVRLAESCGLRVKESRKIFFSRSVLMCKA
jgi:ubiquinone/menaquinone biosynthesis C-methylase UbiE